MGMGEVVEKKGSMWTTTGITRNGKLYCHIEEILFLAERGALLLSDFDETTFSTKDIYKKIASRMAGCSWEAFEAYRHLKSLGYIVGRHGTPWTMKSNVSCCSSDSLHDNSECNELSVNKPEEEITTMFKDFQITEMMPAFDVCLTVTSENLLLVIPASFCVFRGKVHPQEWKLKSPRESAMASP